MYGNIEQCVIVYFIAYIVVEIVFIIFLNFNLQEQNILESFQNGKVFYVLK